MAQITALACSKAPEGRSRWSLRLLADKVVELNFVDDISYKTIERTLKNELKPHLKKQWCIGQINSKFLWRMEQVLDIYEQHYDPRRPVVCFDERPCQLLGDILMPISIKQGRIERQDYHYERN